MLAFMKKYKFAGLGVIIIIAIVLLAIFASFIIPYDPNDIMIQNKLCAPSWSHLFGCDHEGIDLLSKMVFGARVSLYVSLLTILCALIVGTLVGLVSGYYGGALDLLIMRICDIFLAFPGILLAIAIAAMLGPSVNNTIIALCATGWVGFARLVRGEVLAIKEREFVMSAQVLGASNLYIIFVYILPNIVAPIIVTATFSLAGIIIAESSLSFLGLGTPIDTPSWGKMLDSGRDYLFEAPRLSYVPGIAIVILVLSINFIGDALRDHFDPKSRRETS